VDLIARFAEDPSAAAIFLDVDGVLAPIVPRPEDATVPQETRHELRRLAARYDLVACVTGRPSEDAQRVVGVPELVYVGNHGLDLEPEAGDWAARLAPFLAGLDWPRIEDKGITASLHYRDRPDEEAARAELEEIAAQARAEGFVARFGRKVLEILPPLRANKGSAIRHLLAAHASRRGLFAGDDTTDLDGFQALDGLELAVRVAVVSGEGPTELRELADVTVDGPGELRALLQRL
jgi:trehalose 6-phosphate phosphatase